MNFSTLDEGIPTIGHNIRGLMQMTLHRRSHWVPRDWEYEWMNPESWPVPPLALSAVAEVSARAI